MRIVLKALNRAKLLNKFNLVEKVGKFKVPVINGIGYVNLSPSEPWMGWVLKEVLRGVSGLSKFVDVGVNVGQTLLQVKNIRPDISYVGFEPNPICLYYVNELIKANNFQNTTIIPAALSDKTGVINLDYYSNSDIDAMASIVKDFRPDQKVYKRQPVPCIAGSDLNGELRMVSVIKIDVEGGELEVIKGLLDVIKINRPEIIVEILPTYGPDNPKFKQRLARQKELEEILRSIHYGIYRIDKEQKTLIRIQEFGIHSDEEMSDYLLKTT